ncbi:hypothetical protein D0Z07_1093 [Hyphodiscus hymeniophilus]|uniref:Uncharacterized protein n=1 Tax=Hyphodiscus hymeniophilus TaxID=353542 RepID=A0A9P6VQW6_9HELO|nr:hypothetical protein D0Z07_1093 [Hyphodiscus hymeniophilus]
MSGSIEALHIYDEHKYARNPDTRSSPHPHSCLHLEATHIVATPSSVPRTPCTQAKFYLPPEYLSADPCLQSHPFKSPLHFYLVHRNRTFTCARVLAQDNRCIGGIYWVAFIGK